MPYIEFFDKYTFVFSFGYTVIVALVGVLAGKIIPIIKKYKIKKCLSLTKNECKIALPSYDKQLHNKIDIIQMCPIGDIKAASNVIDLIHATGLYSHQHSIFYENNYSNAIENYNIFCVGGSLANKYSYNFFQQFFPNFKIYAPEEKIKTNPNQIPANYFVLSETEKGFCWGNRADEQFLIGTDERYAVIVKLTSEDFGIKNHGTVHILFGNGIEGTLAISKYLLYDYKDLYRRVKRKKHYFIAFKVKRSTGIIDSNSLVDLTDKMFM